MPKNPLRALARLMRGGHDAPGGLVSLICTQALDTPLLVHPVAGQNLLGAYLSGGGDEGSALAVSKLDSVGLIEISGALLSREILGPCGEMPASYEGIGRELDAFLADDAVEHIVLRLSSPGGTAAQCFDLTDRIHAAREQKRIIAVVDDMAYSACFAIAAACSEIWISRTGGVGSVGVVTYHVNQAEWNKKVGIEVEFVYDGDRKIDFNPHSSLSPEARERLQVEINRLGTLFRGTVSRYLNLSEEAVKATQAGCYHGQDAINVGFAHKLGTLRDALASLGSTAAGGSVAVPAATGAVAAASPTAGADLSAQPVAEAADEAAPDTLARVAADAVAAGFADLCAAFLSEGLEPGAARTRLEVARDIRNLCVAAGLPALAADYIRLSRDVEFVRTDLVNARAAADLTTHIDSSHGISLKGNAPTLQLPNRAEIYARRQSFKR